MHTYGVNTWLTSNGARYEVVYNRTGVVVAIYNDEESAYKMCRELNSGNQLPE